MSETAANSAINRILVAVDPCMQSFAALESAAALAQDLQAELIALFVEDLNLIHLAGLPFASEVDRSSGSARQLDSPQMARALRGQAEQARRELQRIGKQRQIQTTLKIVRGHYMAEALSASTAMDVTFLFRTGSARLIGPRAAARAASLAAHRKIDAKRPVWAFYDGSAGAGRALELAKQLTVPELQDLVVLLPPPADAALQSLQHKALALLDNRGASTRFGYLASNDIADMLQAIRREGGSLLLLGRDNARLTERDTQRLLDAIDCPVVLVS